jgi:hypothetical protein
MCKKVLLFAVLVIHNDPEKGISELITTWRKVTSP